MSRTNAHNALRRSSGGFTFVELMMALTISAFIFAGIMSAYLFMGKNLTRGANAQQLEEAGRRAFYLLAQDVSMAKNVQSATGSLSTSSTLNLTIPSGVTITLNDGSRATLPLSGCAGGTDTTITYTYSSTNGTLTRDVYGSTGSHTAVSLLSHVSATGTADTMVNGATYSANGGVTISSFNFKYYNKAGTQIVNPTAAPNIKEVEMTYTATLGTSGAGTQSQYVAVSPRFLLRNSSLL